MSAYDGGRAPVADKDPTQDIQWEIQKIAKSIGQDLTAIVTQLVDVAKQALEEQIKEVVDTLVGYVTNPASFLTDLASWGGNLANWGSLFKELTGNTGGGLFDLSNLLQNGLFGQVNPSRLGLIPLGQLGDFIPNLLDGFLNASYIEGLDIWDFDPLSGLDGLGSATVEANGVLKELLSDPIPVTPGEKIDPIIRTRYAGLTRSGAGNPIQLALNTYSRTDGDELIGQTEVAAVTNPGATNGAGWVELSPATPFVVPDGIGWIRASLKVTTLATGGQVWFTKPELTKPNLIRDLWVDGLPESIDGLWDGVWDQVDDFTDLLGTLSQGASGGFLSSLSAIAQRLLHLDGSGLFDAGGIRNIGSIPQLPNNRVPGLTDIADRVTQALIDPASSGNPIDAIRDRLGQLLDNVRQGADGTPSTGAIVTDLFAAFTGLRQSIASNSIGLSQIQQVMPTIGGQGGGGGSGVTGNSFMDTCERAAQAGWGPGWTSFGAGGVASDGHRWVWNDSGGASRQQWGIYTAGQTLSDYQSVKDVMSSLMESPQAWTGAGPAANNWLIARSNVLGNRFVLVARFYNKIECYDFNNGAFTLIPRQGGGSGSIGMTPVAGARWEFECGNATGLRKFTAYMNDGVVGIWDDVGNITPVGAANRYAGQAMMSDARSGGEATPGSIDLWSVSDKEPPSPTTVIGSGAKMYRANVAAVTLGTTAAETVFPANVFDTVLQKSTDITADPVTGRLTVSEDGWYRVGFRCATNAYTGDVDVLLYKGNGVSGPTLLEYGDTSTGVPSLKGDWAVYLKAGEWVQCGYKESAAQSVTCTGDGQATKTWMKIALLNRSLL